MMTPLLKLSAISRVSGWAIACLVIGSSFLGSSTIAETDSENSSDIFSEPIRNEVPNSQDILEAQPVTPADIPHESKEVKSPKIGDIIEVNPSSQQWDTIQSGDLNQGTIKFRFPSN